MAGSGRMLVVAIDFGTTYSGYAYSFLGDWKKNPLKVQTLNVTTPYGQMAKVPTSVLFDSEQKFHSFGVEAEEEYARMSEREARKARTWYYFERFKMSLYNNPALERHVELLDQTRKKSLPALTVFSAAIAHLKGRFLQTLQDQGTDVEEEEVTWVLTLPAIWEDQARQFMREAALQAGIPGQQLVLALEPEAASVYCLAFSRAHRTSGQPLSLGKGTKFLLVDCGGGTIDLSILEVRADGRLRHLHRPAGTADGGVSVDKAFKDFLIEIVGFDGVTSFEPLEMLELRRSLERTKSSFKANDAKAIIEIPQSVNKTLSVSIASSKEYSQKASLVRNRLTVEGAVFLSFYQQAATAIPAAIRDALHAHTVDAIFLAGGFSQSDVIQRAVQEAFPETPVVTSQSLSPSQGGGGGRGRRGRGGERGGGGRGGRGRGGGGGGPPFSPEAAVLMGAVMYGHDPHVIATRVSAFTYGVGSNNIFEEGVHDEKRAVTYDDGEKRCRDCFSAHIRIGEEVEVNTLLQFQTYNPLLKKQKAVPLNIYRSSKRDPLYVDEEGVEEIGTMTVLVPDTTKGVEREIEVAMQVGGAELRLVARNPDTQEEFTTSCEFLSRN